APVEACFFNWFNCCGGCSPCGSSCGTYYGPVSTGCSSCGTTAYYSPFGWGSTCSDCGTCSPCGSGCSTCASGSCSTGDCGVSGSMPPADTNFKAREKPPQTFGNPDNKSGAEGDSNRTRSNSGFPDGNASYRRPYSGQRTGSPIERTGAEDS